MKNCKNCGHRFGLFPSDYQCLITKTYCSITTCGEDFEKWTPKPKNWFKRLFDTESIDWPLPVISEQPMYESTTTYEYAPNEEQDEDKET